jgi:predicted RNA-binding protein associated with RNAse of E/G family
MARTRVCTALASGSWTTVETTWHTNRILWVWPRAVSYMIGHIWEDATDQFRGWYLNLQTPLRRSHIGFDLWDQLLDVVVRPDRTWFWNDEDQFEDAIRLHVIGSTEAAAVRAQGESLIRGLDALLPTGCEDWRPEPGWPVLELPGGWDRVDERTDETI